MGKSSADIINVEKMQVKSIAKAMTIKHMIIPSGITQVNRDN